MRPVRSFPQAVRPSCEPFVPVAPLSVYPSVICLFRERPWLLASCEGQCVILMSMVLAGRAIVRCEVECEYECEFGCERVCASVSVNVSADVCVR